MIYAYIRVSTDKQTLETQRLEIEKFALNKKFFVDAWVSEIVSGTKAAADRKLGSLLKKMKKGDILIISEISRLGRNLMQIMSILNLCMVKEVSVLTVKEQYELGNNINSQILAFALFFNLLFVTTSKEGLARKRAEGCRLGRIPGKKNSKYKLTGKEDVIKRMLIKGEPKKTICRKLRCSFNTLKKHIARNPALSQYVKDK